MQLIVAIQAPGMKGEKMSEIITWKFPDLYDADAGICKTEIESIGNDVTPHEIVEFAKNPNTELHKCFTWNNDLAAEKWRLHEARQIVCSLVIVESGTEDKDEVKLRVFHKTNNEDGYKPIQFILKDKDEYEKLLERCLADLRALKKKYQTLSEYQEIWDLID